MTKPIPTFDILIIYDASVARSAADTTYHGAVPFPRHGEYYSCNVAYKYFIQYGAQQGLRVAFTTTRDITAAGQFSSAWTYTTKWKRYCHNIRAKVIFDKFSNLLLRNREIYQLLKMAKKPLPLFHNQAMRILFDNKLETYLHFPDYAIPTVKVGALTKAGLRQAKTTLRAICRQHPYRHDFNSDLVLKDQFGIGGKNIFKITNQDDWPIIPANSSTHFVLQPFIQASGFKIAQSTGSTDLRVIIFNNKIIQSYLRIAKAGDFRANAQQGGAIVYLTLDQIPPDVLEMMAGITLHLPSKAAFYALDFIKSSAGHLYFIEGNNSPGLNWFDLEDKKRAKELIRLVIMNLQKLIGPATLNR